MNRFSRRGQADAGFTLIELLITVVILGVITLPLGNFVIAYFQNSTQTTARLNESHDAQMAAAYFAQDVSNMGTRQGQSLAQSVWPGNFPDKSCGSSVGGVNIAAKNQILLLKWDTVTWANPTESVRTDSAAYVVMSASGETQLHRVYCQGGSQVSDVIVAHDIAPSALPQVTCSTTCTAGAVPTTVQLTLNIKDPVDAGSAYSITLTGQRRQTTS
jgi:prepilin-type N-terminal cleavage/methylation domain-containing protein